MKKTFLASMAANCMLAGLGVAGSAAAWADARLVIQGVEIAGQTLTIVGTGLAPRDRSRLRVFLGEAPGNDISALCATPPPTDTAIVCTFAGSLPQNGTLAFNWQLSAYVPSTITDGVKGRRVTFVHAGPPDITADMERFGSWGTGALYFPPGDRRVEIAGVFAGAFPAVVTETPNGLTLEYGFLEGGQIWDWVRNTMNGGSELHRSNLSVVVVDAALNEVSRMNYSQCFPKRYEHFTGFGQALQAKERLFLQCNSRTPG